MNVDKIRNFFGYFSLIALFHDYLCWMTKYLMENTPILSASEAGIYLIRRCCRENGHSLEVPVIL